ncbi:zinc ribbon domain-containing protein [Bifidobacterium saguinibicoloris]|uniref:zinc ribbon domain-containing protein n=1 Tax=Bifidobacterium saguinibicoloris TaxID=2834433 RepID=UPI001C56D030|nr:zinc ribbon domain-containing protein [Bifidobacterium saguinibicoloris]MBW3081594.1 zinc ribbon domain-containing protein [Bifidobacterium saguinibicoloris]
MEDKYCRFCGALLPEGALFCTKCGKATAVVESGEADESAPDDSEPMDESQSSVAEDGAEEFDIALDEESKQNERDVTDESGQDADDDEPHWWKRSDDQVIRESEAAQERRATQQKQKWNRKRIIVIIVVALIIVAAVVGAVLNFRSTTQPGKSHEASEGSGSNSECFVVSGAPYDESCDSDSEDNPSATLRYLFKQLSDKTIGNESVQLGGRNASTEFVPYVYIGSSVGNLQYESGVLWYFGKTIGANPFSYLSPMVSKALGTVGYNESVLSFNGSLDEAGVQKVEDFKKQVPYYRYSVSGYGDVVFGVVAYSVDGGQQFAVDIIVYDADNLPDWVTNIHDSNQTTQSDSSTSSSNQNAESSDSSAVDTDFADLWKTTVDDNDWSKIAGDYCRADGVCVHIAKNDFYDPNTYEGTPGTLSFTAGDSSSNPLPNGQSQVELGFQYQTKQTMPSSPEPFPMFAGCQGSMGCDQGSQENVYFVMPGVNMQYFQQEYFYYPIDSGNPPDSSRDYLVIGQQRETTISDQSVFYRK